jgi:hypothetical protein
MQTNSDRWADGHDVRWMLGRAGWRATDRQVRLFLVACCRRIWAYLDERSRRVVEVAERFADGSADSDELAAAHQAAVAAREAGAPGAPAQATAANLLYSSVEALAVVEGATRAASCVGNRVNGPGWFDAMRQERQCQAGLLRDIFGDPFRPAGFDPRWRSETAVALAAGIYAERAFDRMPVLADGLEEAGCDSAEVLLHCRGDGPHTRGCWVVDLVLGKGSAPVVPGMPRNVFEERLRAAGAGAVRFAREYVRQRLPEEVAFRVLPNQSYDGNPRRDDEEVFPDDSLPDGSYHGPWSAEQVVEFLWRAGKVPEWIDVAVRAEDGRRTLVELRCCGRFTAMEEFLYHRAGGLTPFSIKSPYLPPGWASVEASGRFDLYWEGGPTHA